MPKKGARWPSLAFLLGPPSQGIQNELYFWAPERVYQESRPGRAKKRLFWVFADKRILPNFDEFWPNVDQIWPFWKFLKQPQVNTYLGYQDIKFGPKRSMDAKALKGSHNFL